MMGRYPMSVPVPPPRSEPQNDAQAIAELIRLHDDDAYELEVLWQVLFRLADSGAVPAMELVRMLQAEWLHREHVREDR